MSNYTPYDISYTAQTQGVVQRKLNGLLWNVSIIIQPLYEYVICIKFRFVN